MMLCLQHGTAQILLSGTCPNPAKSMAGAGFAINGRMPDLPEPEPKFGTSLILVNQYYAVVKGLIMKIVGSVSEPVD